MTTYLHSEVIGVHAATGTLTAQQLKALPEGTKVLPPRPSADHQWLVNAWEYVAPELPLLTLEDVKAEAQRRILAVLPEWKQRNLTAQAAILAEKGRSNWTDAELAAWDAGAALWGHVAAIRAQSDRIEALDPIPADYAEDHHWPS